MNPRTGCATFGRFNPPTKGHERLFRAMLGNAPATVYLSAKRNGDNPLSYDDRAALIRTCFPELNVGSRKVFSLQSALDNMVEQGFTDIVLMLGDERSEGFSATAKAWSDSSGVAVTVVSLTRNDNDTVSGTIAREAALANDYEGFKQVLISNIDDATIHKTMRSIREQGTLEEAAMKETLLSLLTESDDDEDDDGSTLRAMSHFFDAAGMKVIEPSKEIEDKEAEEDDDEDEDEVSDDTDDDTDSEDEDGGADFDGDGDDEEDEDGDEVDADGDGKDSDEDDDDMEFDEEGDADDDSNSPTDETDPSSDDPNAQFGSNPQAAKTKKLSPKERDEKAGKSNPSDATLPGHSEDEEDDVEFDDEDEESDENDGDGDTDTDDADSPDSSPDDGDMGDGKGKSAESGSTSKAKKLVAKAAANLDKAMKALGAAQAKDDKNNPDQAKLAIHPDTNLEKDMSNKAKKLADEQDGNDDEDTDTVGDDEETDDPTDEDDLGDSENDAVADDDSESTDDDEDDLEFDTDDEDDSEDDTDTEDDSEDDSEDEDSESLSNKKKPPFKKKS